MERARKPALLVIDMQNRFCHPSGSFAKIGLDVTNMKQVVPHIERLLDACRTSAVPCIFTRVVYEQDYSNAGLVTERMPQLRDVGGFIRNSWDAQVVDELQPDVARGDIVVDKTRNDSFWQTGMEGILAERNIDQLIVVGVGTNVCVEATVRAAFDRDYRMILVADATATLSEEMKAASLQTIGMMWADLAQTDDVVRRFKSI